MSEGNIDGMAADIDSVTTYYDQKFFLILELWGVWSHFFVAFTLNKRLIDWLTDFNGMSTHQWVILYLDVIESCLLFTYIYIFCVVVF